jgi:ribosomal protein L7/L12
MSTDRELYTRVSALQRKVSDLYRRLGEAEPSDEELISSDADPRVIELVVAGKMVEAIKVQREVSGDDLASAKDAVEKIAAGHRPTG